MMINVALVPSQNHTLIIEQTEKHLPNGPAHQSDPELMFEPHLLVCFAVMQSKLLSSLAANKMNKSMLMENCLLDYKVVSGV